MKQLFSPCRGAALLAGVWAGALVGIALLGAPAGFALLPSDVAGKLAGHMLAREAYASLVLCALIFPLVRRQARTAALTHGTSVMSGNVLLVLGALFCTVLGYFGLQPALNAARHGHGLWSFGALHAVSVAFFGLKTLFVLSLAWRFSAPPLT